METISILIIIKYLINQVVYKFFFSFCAQKKVLLRADYMQLQDSSFSYINATTLKHLNQVIFILVKY